MMADHSTCFYLIASSHSLEDHVHFSDESRHTASWLEKLRNGTAFLQNTQGNRNRKSCGSSKERGDSKLVIKSEEKSKKKTSL